MWRAPMALISGSGRSQSAARHTKCSLSREATESCGMMPSTRARQFPQAYRPYSTKTNFPSRLASASASARRVCQRTAPRSLKCGCELSRVSDIGVSSCKSRFDYRVVALPVQERQLRVRPRLHLRLDEFEQTFGLQNRLFLAFDLDEEAE